MTRASIPIKAIAVLGTVGTLDVPDVRPFGFSLYSSAKHEYSFVNMQVAPHVKNAYQGLALDEQRGAFLPVVWESPRAGKNQDHKLQQLRQCGFPGVHTAVERRFQDTTISDLTLAWMMTHMSRHLAFDPGYLVRQRRANEEFHVAKDTPATGIGYSMGLIKRGEYHLTDPSTGHLTKELLHNTHEFIHPSVRYRMQNGGRAPTNAATDTLGPRVYQPSALKDCDYFPAGKDVPVGIKVDFEWNKAPVLVKQSTGTNIVEETIKKGSFDAMLAESWEGVGSWLNL